MYEQIEGFWTCPDLRSASSAEARQPWVPQDGVQNRLMWPSLALCSSTWALGTSTWAQLGQLRANLGPAGDPRRPNPIEKTRVRSIKSMVFEIFYEQCVFGRQDWSKRRPGGSKSDPREARSEPRSTKEALRSLQERPTSRSNSASERFWPPSGLHLAPGSSPEAYLRWFWTSRGTIFHPPGSHFHVFSKLQGPSSKLSCAQSLCKHTASTA